MPIIGSAHINIRALDKNFRRDIENAVKKIRDVSVGVTVDADISAAQGKIDTLKGKDVTIGVDVDDSKLKKALDNSAKNIKPIKIPVEADTSKFEKSVNDATKNIDPVEVPIDVDSSKFKKSMKDAAEETASDPVDVPVDAKLDPNTLKKDIANAIRDIKIDIPANLQDAELMRSLQRLKLEADRLSSLEIGVDIDEKDFTNQVNSITDRLSNTVHQIRVDADTSSAEGKLKFLERTRRVPVVVDMERSARKSLLGVGEALAGLVPPRQVADSIENILGNFTGLTTMMSTVTVGFGALSAAGIAAAGSLLTVGADTARLTGLLALAPAALAATRMATMVLTSAFEGFSKAVTKGGKDLEKLHPAAREAASAMHEVYRAMDNRIKGNFWEEASDSMVRFSEQVMPQFTDSIGTVSTDFGIAFSDMLDAVIRFKKSGDLKPTLDNIGAALGYVSRSVGPVTESILTLGSVGSKYMKELGRSVSTTAKDFNNFIQEAAKTGEIDRWIRDSVTSLQQLGTVVGSTVKIMGNLATAAERAGFGGLRSLSEGFRAVADASGDALVMEQFEDIFRGAGAGAEHLTSGLGVLGRTILESSDGISKFLDVAGEIGQISFENLDVLFNADGFGDGILRALEGFKNGLDAVTPGFDALGRTIGNLGRIAGTLFETMAPGFNNLMILIDKVTAGITDGFIAAMPVVNQFVDMLMTLARGPLVLAANVAGKLLEVFAALPGPIQNTILAIVGLNTALRTLGIAGGILGALGGDFDKVGGKASGATGLVSKLGAALGIVAGVGAGAGRAAGAAADGTERVAGSAGRATSRLGSLGTALAGLSGGLIGVGGGARTATTSVDTVGSSAGKATSRFGALATGALGLARGFAPIGIAVTALTGAFSVYEQTAGNTSARTQELGTALSQYGANSEAAKSATEGLISSHRGVAESVVGLIPDMLGLSDGSTLATRAFDQLGWSVEDVSSAINSSGGAWTDQRQKVEDLISSTGLFGSVTEETSQAVLGTNDAVGLTGEQLRAMRTAMDDANRSVEEHTQSQIRAQEAAQRAANFNRQVAEAVSTNKQAAIEAAGAYDVLASASSTVEDKMSAFQSTISFVNSEFNKSTGGLMSDTQAKMANAQATADLDSAIANVTTTYAGMGEQVITSKGAFVETTAAGRDFYSSMQDIATQIQEVGVRTYDTALKNGDSITVAADKAVASMKPMTDQVRTMLQGMGVTGEEEINKVLSALGLLPEDVKLALNAEGNAADVARETKLIVEGLTSGNYDMAIGAVNEQAMSVIAETVGAGDDFAGGNYEAVFKALAEEYGVADAVKLLEGTAGKDFEAIMELYADDFASDKVDSALEKAGHLDGKSVEAQLSAVDDLTPEVEKSLTVLSEIDGKDANAQISAINNLSDEAKTALGDLLGVDGKNAQAVLDALDNLSPKVREALGMTEAADGKTATVHMEALDNASPKVVGAIDQAIQFDGTNATATLEALDNLSPKAREALSEVLGINDTSGTALLDAINNLTPEAQKALGDVAGIDGVSSTAVIDAINNVDPVIRAALGSIGGLDGKTATAKLEALDNASRTTREALAEVLGINSAEGTALLSAIDSLSPEAQAALDKLLTVDGAEAVAGLSANDGASPKIATAGINLDLFKAKDGNKDITATDNASGVLTFVSQLLGAFAGTPADKSINATDNTSSGVSSAQSTMSTLADVTRGLFGSNQAGPGKDAAQGTLNTLLSVTRSLFGSNQAAPGKEAAQGTLNTLTSVTRSLFGSNQAAPGRNAAQNTLESLRNVTRSLFGSNQAAPGRNAAQNTLESLRNVTRSLFASNQAHGGKNQAQGTINSLAGKTVNLEARDLTGGAVSSAKAAIASVVGKTVNVVTNFISRGRNAEGGIWADGVRAYADGGITQAEAYANGGIKMPSNVKTFASGSERHVAQIAQGKWPVRVWAEPETGGEAYIPLSVSKRPQSLDILKQVAEMFGFSLVKKFADGGILKGIQPGKTNHFADGGFSTTRNVSGYVTRTRTTSSNAVPVASSGSVVYSPTMNVYPSAPLNEEQVAESVARDLFWKILNN